MRRSSVRDALLAEVKKRQRAAGQKVSRLERQGIRVRKEGLDPRVSSGGLNEMNSRQLRTYLGQLNRFTSRSTSFVAGVQGRPISGGLFAQYKKLERQFNAQVSKFALNIGDIQVPGTGMTIAQRNRIRETSVFAGGDFKTFQQINRTAANLTGNDAVKKFISGMQKKLDPGYLSRDMKNTRDIIAKMFEASGDDGLQKVVDDMSDTQLVILVDNTDFMDKAGYRYEQAKSINSDSPRWQSQVYDNAGERVESLIDWAQNLPDNIDYGNARGVSVKSDKRRKRK